MIWTGEASGILEAVPGIFAASGAMVAPMPGGDPTEDATDGQRHADLLLSLTGDTQAAIDAASRFAAWQAAPGHDRLVVTIIRHADPADWDGTRQAALLWAFTRYAALAWAPRRIRVNAVGLGAAPRSPLQPPEHAAYAAGLAPADRATPADIANAILAMWRWPSMTGQLVQLGQGGLGQSGPGRSGVNR